jgi:periplasmic copper chaperone A
VVERSRLRRYHSPMHPYRFRATFALALSLSTGIASAATTCLPTVRDGWIRLGPAGMDMLAGYARIDNTCAAPVEIVAASSPAFADVSLHETRIDHGISRMRALTVLPVAAHASVAFAPGGLHLMLMDPTKPLKAGDDVSIDFTLGDGRRIPGRFQLRAAPTP